MAKGNDSIATKEIFVMRRSFNASRELLFAAFTDPGHLMRWWAPKNFKMVYCKLDLRPHGMLHYCALSPEGKPAWGSFEFRKIQVGQRIVFINAFSEENENSTSFPGWPMETLNQVIFMEHEGKTTLMITTEELIPADKKPKSFIVGFKQMKQEFNEAFDQLEDYLAGTNGNLSINKIA